MKSVFKMHSPHFNNPCFLIALCSGFALKVGGAFFPPGGPQRVINKEGVRSPQPGGSQNNSTSSSLFSVKCIRSTPEYFAERLFKAMKVCGGLGGNEPRGWRGRWCLCPSPWNCRHSLTSLWDPLATESYQRIGHRRVMGMFPR